MAAPFAQADPQAKMQAPLGEEDETAKKMTHDLEIEIRHSQIETHNEDIEILQSLIANYKKEIHGEVAAKEVLHDQLQELQKQREFEEASLREEVAWLGSFVEALQVASLGGSVDAPFEWFNYAFAARTCEQHASGLKRTRQA